MSENKKLKIILDANWYISACISRKSRRTLYYEILRNPRFHVFYSAELLAEFERVIARPKFSKIISTKYVSYFKAIALTYLSETKMGTVPSVVRDANDNYLLGVCEGIFVAVKHKQTRYVFLASLFAYTIIRDD